MSNTLQLVDNIESNWRNVQDLGLGTTDEGESLLGVTISPVCFGLWAVPFKQIHFDGQIPEKPDLVRGVTGDISKVRASELKIPRTFSSNENDGNKKQGPNIQKSLDVAPTQNNIFQQNIINIPQQPEKVQQQEINIDLIAPSKENSTNKRQNTSQGEVKKMSPKKVIDDNILDYDVNLNVKGLQESISPPNQNQNQKEQNEWNINENHKSSSIIHFEGGNNGNNDDLNYSIFLNPQNKKQNDIIYDVNIIFTTRHITFNLSKRS